MNGADSSLVDVVGQNLGIEAGLSGRLQTQQQFGAWRDSKEAARLSLFSSELPDLELPSPKLTPREAALHAKAAEVCLPFTLTIFFFTRNFQTHAKL